MGNLKINKINDIVIDTGFLRNYGFYENVNLINTCNKTGQYRIFNGTVESIPPDGKSIENGGSDYYVFCYATEPNKYIRLEAKSIRSENMWILECINGSWKEWVLLPNNIQIKSKMDLKVDKVTGKSLSENDFTTTYKNAVSELINTSFFKGYFETVAQIQALPSPKNGWYGFVTETKTIWYYNTTWKNLLNENTGDMKKAFYDPNNKAVDVYSRSNHTGVQSISTITDLQTQLDGKLNKIDKTKVIDNFESDSPIDALSANCGGFLRDKYMRIISGLDGIEYGSLKDKNGWTKLSNGIILQWGQKDMGVGYDNTTLEVPFNIPFPNQAFVVMATPIATTTSGSGSDSAYTSIIDNTKFYLCKDYKGVSVAKEISWFAIGF